MSQNKTNDPSGGALAAAPGSAIFAGQIRNVKPELKTAGKQIKIEWLNDDGTCHWTWMDGPGVGYDFDYTIAEILRHTDESPNAEVSDVCPPLASETEKPRTGTRSLH